MKASVVGIDEAVVPRRRVLVVDDERINRLILSKILSARFDVVEAEDGRSAVEAALSGIPEVVLMDIQMPHMDGYEATRAIKKACGSRHLPILLMTASNNNEALAQGLDAGADDFITKPISRLLLDSKVGAALRAVDMFRQVNQQNEELARFRDHSRRDLAVAKRVFECLLQRGCLSLPSLRFEADPMETFNGDMVMAAPVPPDRLRIFLGDFAGHGLSAAVGTMPVSDIFYATASRAVPLEQVLREMNSKLQAILPRHLFLSAFIAELELSTGRLLAWNAGLPEAFVLTSGGQIRARIGTRRTPLGVRKTEVLDTRLDCFTLTRGERLLVYSDGVIETGDPRGELFGTDRLESVVQNSSGSFASEALRSALREFRSGEPLHDDVTYIEIANDQALADSVSTLLSIRGNCPSRDGAALQLTLDAPALKRRDLGEHVRTIVGTFMSDGAVGHSVQTVVNELLMNALDHGVLRLTSALKDEPDGFQKYYDERLERLAELSSGFVRISLYALDMDRNRMRIRVEDSGNGYFPSKESIQEGGGLNIDTLARRHGRGLELVRALSESVEVIDGGRAVEVVVALMPAENS